MSSWCSHSEGQVAAMSLPSRPMKRPADCCADGDGEDAGDCGGAVGDGGGEQGNPPCLPVTVAERDAVAPATDNNSVTLRIGDRSCFGYMRNL